MAILWVILKWIFAILVIAVLSWGFIEWKILSGDEGENFYDEG